LNEVVDRGGRLRVIEPNNLEIAEIDINKDIEKAIYVYENSLSEDRAEGPLYAGRVAARV
jgi:hypothetical protein